MPGDIAQQFSHLGREKVNLFEIVERHPDRSISAALGRIFARHFGAGSGAEMSAGDAREVIILLFAVENDPRQQPFDGNRQSQFFARFADGGLLWGFAGLHAAAWNDVINPPITLAFDQRDVAIPNDDGSRAKHDPIIQESAGISPALNRFTGS